MRCQIFQLSSNYRFKFFSGMDMRVNIPVRSRGWGFRGRRISHAMHPPPTNANFSLGRNGVRMFMSIYEYIYILFICINILIIP